MYEMDQPDGYGNLEPVTPSDADKYGSGLVKAGLLDRVYSGDSGLLIFAEDIAEFCNATEADAEAKPKQTDPELSEKRRAGGAKGRQEAKAA